MNDQFKHFHERIEKRRVFMSKNQDACNGNILIAFARYMLPAWNVDGIGCCKDEAEQVRVRELEVEGYKLLNNANKRFKEYE